jgi:hypothetical protein
MHCGDLATIVALCLFWFPTCIERSIQSRRSGVSVSTTMTIRIGLQRQQRRNFCRDLALGRRCGEGETAMLRPNWDGGGGQRHPVFANRDRPVGLLQKSSLRNAAFRKMIRDRAMDWRKAPRFS